MTPRDYKADAQKERAAKLVAAIDRFATELGIDSLSYFDRHCVADEKRWFVWTMALGLGARPPSDETWALARQTLRNRLPAPTLVHSRDTDCDVDPETGCCRGCGVLHGDPCPRCGGRGFHDEGAHP